MEMGWGVWGFRPLKLEVSMRGEEGQRGDTSPYDRSRLQYSLVLQSRAQGPSTEGLKN